MNDDSSSPAPPRARAIVEGLEPCVDGGRFAAKRSVGEALDVRVRVFADGHDKVGAEARLWPVELRSLGSGEARVAALEPGPNDVWSARFDLSAAAPGRYRFTARAWIDRFATWRAALAKRLAAGQDPASDVAVGVAMVREAASSASGADRAVLDERARALAAAGASRDAIEAAADDELAAVMRRCMPRHFAVEHEPYELVIDRERARFSTWYELFPRSFGGFRGAESMLDYVASMGFDILYMPPIHPVGIAHRKGKNNTTTAEPGDVGSPWAIGGPAGGHRDIHPELGTVRDFERFCKAAGDRGIEIALDMAFQCSPDHPYVREHPDWFRKRPDGSIQYAENPPKKYQDIYPLDFECEDWRGLWDELAQVFELWVDRGVRVFRVDNPHTKPFRFWDWVIERVRNKDPNVVFLSEAFARPAVMYRLAKGGFTQSYTYFAWKNARWELEQYFTEVTQSPVADFFRPNAWPNTPDILNEYLQVGGRPAFAVRAVLAATLCASYGIYGPAFELCENAPVRPGSEEYLDSEKYQLRDWNIDQAHSLRGLLTRLNRARRDHRALQFNDSLHFHATSNDSVICYSKRSADGADAVLVVANLDPFHRHSAWVELDTAALGVHGDRPFAVRDLIGDAQFLWNGPRNYVELDPNEMPAHVFAVRPQVRTETDFDYFA